ncbi:TonB-dependent receptor [Undibacterium cyanobacteriorum]|uniref:TonB-dependent receptor n=1 Tax=Undibacterium cyanobacteriorum TaxID=3073561 RepID=A0ABY9RDN6_9BURK|nr:TonB-dependent receptor [Undibacterium sp. 20NA77.5]WMW79289.1 TonB-dependent receptor [Undibacterium sp. 20NA77.5]
MNSFFKLLATAAAVAAAFPSQAQNSQSSQMAANFDTNETVVITAGRQAQVAKDVLADNLVITAEEIARSGATTVVDLLQQQRGIEISRTGGAGSVASIFIRGAGNAQSVVFIDGVRIGASTTGGATWSTIPLAQIERIEVVYGPLSSLYGADAMGGVIQLFTKKDSKAATSNASYGVGSDGLRRWNAGIFSSDAGSFSYALNAARESSDGFSAAKPGAGAYTYNLDKDGYTQKSASGNMTWKFDSDWKLGVTFLQSTLDVQFDAGPSYNDRNQQKLENTAVFLKGKFSSDWQTQLQYARGNDRVFTDASYGKSSAETLQRGWTWQNNISFGRDVLQLIAEKRNEDVTTTTAGVSGERDTNSYAAAYTLKQEAHLATASVRRDQSSQFGSHNTYNLAYGYRLTENLRANVSYGTSFRAPSFNELYYPGYGISTNRPELGKNKEIGFLYDDNVNSFSGVYYDNKVTDLLATANPCPVQQSTHKYGCAYNINKASLSGWTFAASTKLDQLRLRASVDLQDPKDDLTGNRLPRRAKQHATLGADYRWNQWSFGIENVLSGERFDDQANKNRLGGYGLLNLVSSYQFAKNWSVLARWNNIADKKYELARNYNTPGSKFFIALSMGSN